MAKKKKKVNSHAQQKLQAVHHKKLYMERLRKVCTQIGDGEPLFDLLPQSVLDVIYKNRGTTIKVKVADNLKVTRRFVKIIYCHLEKKLKEEHFIELELPGGKEQISFADYYQLLMPLEMILRTGACQFAGMEKFNEIIDTYDGMLKDYTERLMYILMNTCYTYSDLRKHILYTHKYDVYRGTEEDARRGFGLLYQALILGALPLDVRYVDIDGERLQVIQSGEIAYRDDVLAVVPTTVLLKRLHIKDPSGKKTLPVYIRQHAIDRTIQRASFLLPCSVQLLIFEAFKSSRIVCEGDRYLVECYSGRTKIGYFVGALVDEIFVILTFRLITHSSMPEGRELARLSGSLQCDDMAFLAIDDLKTFANSDIAKNPRVSEIFMDAGCESILKMNKNVNAKRYYWLWEDKKQDHELAKLISEYIQLGDSDKEYFENE
jgi:hypothetical protein